MALPFPISLQFIKINSSWAGFEFCGLKIGHDGTGGGGGMFAESLINHSGKFHWAITDGEDTTISRSCIKIRKMCSKKKPKIDPFKFFEIFLIFTSFYSKNIPIALFSGRFSFFFSFHHFIGQKHTKLGDRKSPFFYPFGLKSTQCT
jgi:hypothetical protein